MDDVDSLLNDVIDGIDKASAQRMQLTEEIDAVKAAKKQVTESGDKSVRQLEEHFSRVRTELNALLQKRESMLKKEILQIQTDAMAPLDTCEKSLDDSVKQCVTMMEQGKKLLMGNHEESKGAMVEYKHTVSRTKFENISWAPSLQDVQCIHIDLPEVGLVEQVQGSLEDYGTVFAQAPVHITGIQAMPGALGISWREIEEESDLDLSDFRLQYAEAKDDEEDLLFKDAYEGTNQSAVVRRLEVGKRYAFRVSGKADGAEAWSPWSIPVKDCTMMPHYEWSNVDGNNYTLSSEGRVAEKLSEDDSIIMSARASFQCGHSIKFQILCDATYSDNDGFFLSVAKDIEEPWKHKGTLFVSSQGIIVLGGEQKTTKLEKFTKNSILTFDTEVLEDNKIRTSIEMNNKYSATFDWVIDSCQSLTSQAMMGWGMGMMGNQDKSIHLYFGAKFTNPKWKFSVE